LRSASLEIQKTDGNEGITFFFRKPIVFSTKGLLSTFLSVMNLLKKEKYGRIFKRPILYHSVPL